MADLEPHVLSSAIDQIYATFFYSDFTLQIQNLPEETLFGQFVTTLNNVFETKLSRALGTYHVSKMEDLSLDPANFRQSPTSPEHHEEHLP